MKTWGLFLSLIGILFITHCSSMPPDNYFIVNNLDSEEKSKVICEKGIKLYKSQLEKEENYRMLGEIQEYFEVALRFNPENEKAEEYLGKINNFIIVKVEEKIGIAEKLLKKKKRSDKENFSLAFAVKKAYELDPENSEVLELKKETNTITNELITAFLEQSEAELKKIDEKDSPEQKSKKFIKALDPCLKVLQLDPENKDALSKNKEIKSELEGIVKNLLKDAKDTLSKKDYKGTDSLLKTCIEINKKLDAKYKDEINELSYELYFTWAGVLFKEKDYKGASSKIIAAIRAKNTKEAIELKNKITKLKQNSDFANSFKKWLEEIDSLVKKNKYVAAYDKIQSILSKTKDKKYIKELKNKENMVKEKIPGVYDKAIKYYNQDKFKEAIELLKIVVHIDENFKQAKDYLKKAEDMQKLLDSY